VPRQRRTKAALPGDVGGLAQLQEQVELLREEVVIVTGVEAEKREGFPERSATDDEFGPALGDQVERRELLEDAHRIGRAQDRHGARQADLRSAGRRGGQDDDRRGIEELGAVVLADAEYVEPDAVGNLDLVEELGHPIGRDGSSAPVAGSGRMAAKLSMPISMKVLERAGCGGWAWTF
jgi:hypothetical protein